MTASAPYSLAHLVVLLPEARQHWLWRPVALVEHMYRLPAAHRAALIQHER
jgi:hypothetical protein